MYSLDVTQNITKELLLSKYPEEQYMEFYLEIPIKKGLFCSPPWLRKDNNPTCSFYKNTRGNLIFKDFAGISGGFVDIVMIKFNCTYYKALRIIANDFGFITIEKLEKNPPKMIYTGNILKTTEKAKIQVEIQEFTKKELDWWNSFGISLKCLEKFKVYSIKSVFLNGNYFMSSSESSPIYGYYGGTNSEEDELWRLYMPTKRNYRFLSNWSSTQWHGSKQLPNNGPHCILTKSMKDLLCLHEFGITSIAPTSENILMTPSQMTKLSNKFTNIFLLFDNDLPGVRGAHKYKKAYNFRCIFIKRKYAKDISDLYKKVSSAVFWTIIDELNTIILDPNIRKTKHFYIF